MMQFFRVSWMGVYTSVVSVTTNITAQLTLPDTSRTCIIWAGKLIFIFFYERGYIITRHVYYTSPSVNNIRKYFVISFLFFIKISSFFCFDKNRFYLHSVCKSTYIVASSLASRERLDNFKRIAQGCIFYVGSPAQGGKKIKNK